MLRWVDAERTRAPECAVGFFPWPLSLTLPSEERDPPCCSTLETWCRLPWAPETLLGVWARLRGAGWLVPGKHEGSVRGATLGTAGL